MPGVLPHHCACGVGWRSGAVTMARLVDTAAFVAGLFLFVGGLILGYVIGTWS